MILKLNPINIYDAFKEMLHHKEHHCEIPCKLLFIRKKNGSPQLLTYERSFCSINDTIIYQDSFMFPGLFPLNGSDFKHAAYVSVPNTYLGVKHLINCFTFSNSYDKPINYWINQDTSICNLNYINPIIIMTESLFLEHKDYIKHIIACIKEIDGMDTYRLANAALYLSLYNKLFANTFSVNNSLFKKIFLERIYDTKYWKFLYDVYDGLQVEPTLSIDIGTIMSKIPIRLN